MTTNLSTTRRGICPVAFFVFATVVSLPCCSVGADASQMQTFRGATMGTTYMVKVSGAPEIPDWHEETEFAIDRELRKVNDQMSTYLRSSELSRFNNSESTDWFEVSRQTAEVVRLAFEIGEQSGGMLDVTVGSLVDRWNFGPGKHDQAVPSDQELAVLKESVGHRFLEVRLDPPSLKKQIPKVSVDLSAIAKGHGVDRIVELLAWSRSSKHVCRDWR